ncbi:hypothetical protein EMCG_07244 [[Emmonsia] crescens]|uniref:Aminoglycoside phosphotransferase domain-containing protein n=1 Tax=[Emmonsia] crescens TaxID=73230 RepID=A0A0G2I971_9EURO|nr:hypothetical protein EMCG_07244 [Emmonsia crescens UAMH 3008]
MPKSPEVAQRRKNVEDAVAECLRQLQACCADPDSAVYDTPSDSSEGDDPSNRNASIPGGDDSQWLYLHRDRLRQNGCNRRRSAAATRSHAVNTVHERTIKRLIHHLQHEANVYDYLSKLQGSSIPVCLGNVNLREPFTTDGLDLIVHYLLLSRADELAGLRLSWRGKKAPKAVGRYAVVHGDVRPANVTWNSELSRPMLIDFDKTRLERKRPLTRTGSNGTDGRTTKQKRRKVFQVV